MQGGVGGAGSGGYHTRHEMGLIRLTAMAVQVSAMPLVPSQRKQLQ